MTDILVSLILFPLRVACFLVEVLGRVFVFFLGLSLFGLGAFLCMWPPTVLFGAPLCLLGLVLVFKSL